MRSKGFAMRRFCICILAVSMIFAALWALSTTVYASPSQQAAFTPTPIPPGVSVPGQGAPPVGDYSVESDLSDCRECHWDIFLIWEDSSHGKGLSCSQCHLAVSEEDNHARSGHGAQEGGSQECMDCHTTGYDVETDTWEEDNIHCTACHSPMPPRHPDDPAPTDRSADLCGECHIQANFEWQISVHGLKNVSCVDCHNQHRTTLKSPVVEIAKQCAVCHETLEEDFSMSLHAGQGISCADCHLAPLENQSLGRGNARLNHTFEVDISACLQCHYDMLHDPEENLSKSEDAHLYEQIAETKDYWGAQKVGLDAMASAVNVDVHATPPPPNTNNFMAFATVFGAGAGIGAISWTANLLYQGFRKLKKRKEK